MQNLIDEFFKEDQRHNFISVLGNIDKINCDDKVFQLVHYLKNIGKNIMEQKQNKKLESLKEYIFEERLYDVLCSMFIFESYKIQTIDDLLNLKLNVINKIVDKLKGWLSAGPKNFLYDKNNKLIILDNIKFSSRYVNTIFANLKLAETFEKISLDEQTIEALKYPDGIKVASNHNLVNLCKSIYRLSENKGTSIILGRFCQRRLFSEVFVKENGYIDVFINIKKIQCDENNEFNKFQEEIKDYYIKQDNDGYCVFIKKPEIIGNTK